MSSIYFKSAIYGECRKFPKIRILKYFVKLFTGKKSNIYTTDVNYRSAPNCASNVKTLLQIAVIYDVWLSHSSVKLKKPSYRYCALDYETGILQNGTLILIRNHHKLDST